MRRRELMLLLGGAMIAARALRAQQKAMPVIGYLRGQAPLQPFEPCQVKSIVLRHLPKKT
jgi:hypothetical protein